MEAGICLFYRDWVFISFCYTFILPSDIINYFIFFGFMTFLFIDLISIYMCVFGIQIDYAYKSKIQRMQTTQVDFSDIYQSSNIHFWNINIKKRNKYFRYDLQINPVAF